MTSLPRVSVQGAPGCFSHAAALTLFAEVDLVPCETFLELFDSVTEGRAQVAMVPVENALAGAVAENLDLLVDTRLEAVAETFVPVEMCLAVRPSAPEPAIPSLTAAASHPVALRQCRKFFHANPHIRSVVASDTAGSIREMMQRDPGWDAGIGPALAADLYGARIVARGIQDDAANFTRFLALTDDASIVGRMQGSAESLASHKLKRTGLTKLSLAFTAAHAPGSLHRAIGVFANAGLDLTRIESRPIPGLPWEYRFHVDVRAKEPGALDRALDDLAAVTSEVVEVGRYSELTHTD